MASPIKISPGYFPPPPAVAKLRPAVFPRDQIAVFYLELRSPLCASLRRWNLPAEEVEDIVQDAFVRLLSHGPEDLKAENARYWLFRVAHNLAIDRQRSGWRSLVDSQADFDLLVSVRPCPDSDPEKVYLRSEAWRVVQHNLARLTPRQRHAIHLRITGLTYEAIAHQLKGTTGSVAELIRRGLKRLGGNSASSTLEKPSP